MAGKIFVNYRRGDSAAHALSVAQYLERAFGAHNVFIDVDRMRAGQVFPKVLEARLAECKVMLCVIGPLWLGIEGEDGRRRLDDPEDWVRLEIVRALARGIAVIPVLAGGANLPRRSELPDDLKPLVAHHAVAITTNGFRSDMAGLARDIGTILGGGPSWGAIGAGLAGLAVAGGLAAWQMGDWGGAHRPDDASPGAGVPGAAAPGPSAAQAAEAARRQQLAMLAEGEKARAEAERKVKEEAARKAREAAEAERKRQAAAALVPIETREAKSLSDSEQGVLKTGDTFKECADCPEMVVVPAGAFTMGSSPTEIAAVTKESGSDWYKNEGPQRKVTIAKAFAVGKFEVTFAEWEACVSGGGCSSNKAPGDEGWGRDTRPVINVSWNDAKEYAAWFTKKTGATYRLLTEAEWEYAARGGPDAKEGGRLRYWWGDTASHEYANYGKDECCGGLKQGKDQWETTAPVGQFPANPFWLHHLHGNVWEWVEDCYQDSYNGAPADGTPRKTTGDCTARVLRGGSWDDDPQVLRSADRNGYDPDYRDDGYGFRLGRTLTP